MIFKINKKVEDRIRDIQNKLSYILSEEGLIVEENFAINQILYRGLEAISKDLKQYEDTGKFSTYIFNNYKCVEEDEDTTVLNVDDNSDKLLGFLSIEYIEKVFNASLEDGTVPDSSNFKDVCSIIEYLEPKEIAVLDNIIKYLWSEFISEGERLVCTGKVENIDFKYVCDNSEKFMNLIKSLGEFSEDIISKDRYYSIVENNKNLYENTEGDLASQDSNKVYEEDKKTSVTYDSTAVVMGFIKMKDLEVLFNSCLKEGLYPSILDLQDMGYSFAGCGLNILQNMEYKISGLWHIFIEQIKIFISKNVNAEIIDFKYVYENSPKFEAMIQSINDEE